MVLLVTIQGKDHGECWEGTFSNQFQPVNFIAQINAVPVEAS